MNQQGGALLEKGGAYGCMFQNPTPICATTHKPINTEIAKVIVESGTGQQEEAKKTMILQKIPELKEYIIIATEICKADTKQVDPDWFKCFLTGKDDPLLILGMRDGGETFMETLHQNPATFANSFLKLLEYLLEGVILMHTNGWNHTDIHDKNILIVKKELEKGIARFIDFGLAYNKNKPNVEEMDRFSSRFEPHLKFMPPEYHVYTLNRDPDVNKTLDISRIISQQIYADIEGTFPSATPIQDVIPLLQTNRNVVTDPRTFYTVNGDKIDVWSLGVTFYQAYNELQKWPRIRELQSFSDEKRENIKAILEMMLKFDPTERGTAKDILRLVNPNHRFLHVARLPPTILPPTGIKRSTLSATVKRPTLAVRRFAFNPPPFSSKILTRRGTQKRSQNFV